MIPNIDASAIVDIYIPVIPPRLYTRNIKTSYGRDTLSFGFARMTMERFLDFDGSFKYKENNLKKPVIS